MLVAWEMASVQGRRTQPSALDSPRFFDDAALSGWRVGNNPPVAASKQTFEDAKAFTRLPHDNAPSPTLQSDNGPIPIEFVRGANGPQDDTWTVVVDGMRCQLEDLKDGTFKCALPGGVPFDKVITQATQVRSVSIAVRLENEAEVPLSAEVYLTQIMQSTEREKSPTDDEKTIGGRVAIQPYRTRDVSAKAVTMPYPFWAPSQSALGILSLKPANRANEREGVARAFNLYNTMRKGAESAVYDGRKLAYDKLTSLDFLDLTLRQGTDYLAKLTNEVKSTENDGPALSKSEINRFRQTLRPPKPPVGVPPRLVRRVLDVNGESYVVGGKSKSAVAELTDMFGHLITLCKRMRDEAKAAKKQLSLRAQLGVMRMALITDYEGDEKTAALFDALLDVDPYPPAQLLFSINSEISLLNDDGVVFVLDDRKNLTNKFRREYIVSELRQELERRKGQEIVEDVLLNSANLQAAIGAGAAGSSSVLPDEHEVVRVPFKPAADLTPEARKAFINENNAYIDSEKKRLARIKEQEESVLDNTWGGKDYMFLYDRMFLEQRKSTTLHTRINVHIVNFDGSELNVGFESNEEDGIVAHAVYSEFRKEVDNFDVAAQELVHCLFDVHAQPRGLKNEVKDYFGWAGQGLKNFVFGKYASKDTRVRSPYFGDIFQLLLYNSYGRLENLASELVDGTRFNLDPCRMEERIAELRIMARETIPIWPPVQPRPDSAVVWPEEREVSSDTPGNTSDTLGSTSTPLATAPPASPVPISGLFPPSKKQREKEMQRKEEMQRKQEKEIAKRANEIDPAAGNITDPLGGFSRIYPGMPKAEQEKRIIVRELPQIVVPGSALALAFLPYHLDNALELMAARQQRGWWPSIGWNVVLVSTWAVSAFFGYELYTRAFSTAMELSKSQLGVETKENLIQTSITTFMNPFAEAVRLLQSPVGQSLFRQFAPSSLNPFDIEVSKIGEDAITARQWWEAWIMNSKAIPVASNLATWTLSLVHMRAQKSQRYTKLVVKMQRELVGKPANSAVAAANTAIKKMRSASKELRNRAGVADSAAVVYNEYSGRRFGFYEYYENTDALVERIQGLSFVHKGVEWTSVPDGGALRLFPPLDVADKMYEAEVLRGVPITKTISFTAGTPPALAATSLAELTAKAAFQEIMQVIHRARRLLCGQHLVQSATVVGLELVQNAAALLRASYGTSAGITLVDGDDIIWTCLQGGVAARLALRHLALFDEAESRLLPVTGGKRVDETLRFWRRPRRGIMDDFVKAFVNEAIYAARQERMVTPHTPSVANLSTEATRSFARTRVLVMNKPGVDDLEKTTLLAVVVSSMAHGLLMNTHSTDDFIGTVANLITVAKPGAEVFDYQTDFHIPKPPSCGSELDKATWASRRIAPPISRSIEMGWGAQDIVEKLSALDVSDSYGSNTTTRLYYCPMGGRIGALPGVVPFAIDSLESRVVWMEVLQRKALMITQAVVEASSAEVPTPDGALFLDTVPLSGGDSHFKPTQAPKKLVGMARHPLVIQQSGSVIYVPTSFTSEPASPEPSPHGVPDSLLDTMKWLQALENENFPYTTLRARVRHMRTVAFNAERFMFALALSRVTAACTARIEVRLRSVDQVASLALAFALLEVEMASLPVEVRVYVDDVEAACTSAEAIAAQARQALSSNCRVCSLAEAALCL